MMFIPIKKSTVIKSRVILVKISFYFSLKSRIETISTIWKQTSAHPKKTKQNVLIDRLTLIKDHINI